MWAQIVGKVALAQAPPINHSWGVAMEVTPRGLSTHPLPHGQRSFTMEFDFVRHCLVILTSDGETASFPLVPMSVSDFYSKVMATLQGMSLPVTIWPMPVEIPDPIRFDEDVQHHAYVAEQASRFWRILVQVERVFAASRSPFVGKCSPVNFFWGSLDLAITRFSGRLAPPREGPAFMRDAYSHEVISHGFWPGSGPVLEPAFYAYAVPQPAGLSHASVEPDAAYYHQELGEFILPYAAVRTAASPEAAILAFIDSTYDAAANLAHWDRPALERPLSVRP
jgi:hypothetical protein